MHGGRSKLLALSTATVSAQHDVSQSSALGTHTKGGVVEAVVVIGNFIGGVFLLREAKFGVPICGVGVWCVMKGWEMQQP